MAENNNKQENIILCGANSYQQKYYFNEKFKLLPENIKKELQIMCVLFTEDVGGILFLEFTPEGNLEFRVEAEDQDYLFDEIGSGLKIRQYQREKKELFRISGVILPCGISRRQAGRPAGKRGRITPVSEETI